MPKIKWQGFFVMIIIKESFVMVDLRLTHRQSSSYPFTFQDLTTDTVQVMLIFITNIRSKANLEI